MAYSWIGSLNLLLSFQEVGSLKITLCRHPCYQGCGYELHCCQLKMQLPEFCNVNRVEAVSFWQLRV